MGVDIIFKNMLLSGKGQPTYRLYDDAVALILWKKVSNPAYVKFVVKEQEKNQVMFNLTELLILRELTQKEQIQLSEILKIAQIDMETAQRCCQSLTDFGLIESIKGGYTLTSDAYDSFHSMNDMKSSEIDLGQYTKARTLILDSFKDGKGYVTRTFVEKLCGLSKKQSLSILEKMIEEKLISREGVSRRTRYLLLEKLEKES